MQTKNIYILFPPGYNGNYLSWAIDKSNAAIADSTIDNPINTTATPKFGGIGSSHLHARIPTHHVWKRTSAWIANNRPLVPKIYVVDASAHVHETVHSIMQQDSTGVFINIHAANDPLIESYGQLNSAIKWPTNMLAALTYKESSTVVNMDLFNCADDINVRNSLAINYGYSDSINTPIDYAQLDKLLDNWHNWHLVRNKYQPHEVNSDTYLMDRLDYTNRIFELSCLDVASPALLPFLRTFLEKSEAISEYDCTYVADFHHNYIEAQPNLQWFASIEAWRQTRHLDEFLLSHSVIQSQVITEMFRQAGVMYVRHEERQRWDIQCQWLTRLNQLMHNTSPLYQGELPEFFFSATEPYIRDSKFCKLIVSGQWKSMTLREINVAFTNMQCRTED